MIEISIPPNGAPYISSNNFKQILELNSIDVYKLFCQFLRKSKQLALPDETVSWIWDNRETLESEKLTPMERMKIQEITKAFPSKQIEWEDILPLLREKIGSSAERLIQFENKVGRVLKLIASPGTGNSAGGLSIDILVSMENEDLESYIEGLKEAYSLTDSDLFLLKRCLKVYKSNDLLL